MEAGFKNPRAGPAGSQLWVLPQGHPRQKGNGPRAGKGAPPDIVPDTGLRPPGSPGGSNGGAETSTKDQAAGDPRPQPLTSLPALRVHRLHGLGQPGRGAGGVCTGPISETPHQPIRLKKV